MPMAEVRALAGQLWWLSRSNGAFGEMLIVMQQVLMTHSSWKLNWLLVVPLELSGTPRGPGQAHERGHACSCFLFSCSLFSSPTATPAPFSLLPKCCVFLSLLPSPVGPFSRPRACSPLCLYPTSPGPTCSPATLLIACGDPELALRPLTWHRRAPHFGVSGKKVPTPVPSLPPGTPHSGLQTDLLGPRAPGGRPKPGPPNTTLAQPVGIFHSGHHHHCPARALAPPSPCDGGGEGGRH